MSPAFLVPAVGNGGFIMILFVLGMFAVLAFGYYTRRGSGIDAHPSDGLDGAPGAGGPSEFGSKGRSPGTSNDGDSVGDTFSTHGTR